MSRNFSGGVFILGFRLGTRRFSNQSVIQSFATRTNLALFPTCHGTCTFSVIGRSEVRTFKTSLLLWRYSGVLFIKKAKSQIEKE
jgi:hypothetical protein